MLSSPARLRARAYIAVLPALIMREEREHARHVYETDSLRIVGENTARYAGGGYMTKRYLDIIEPKPQDSRSAEEIAAEVIKKAGLVVR